MLASLSEVNKKLDSKQKQTDTFANMADLKKELDDYLSRNNEDKAPLMPGIRYSMLSFPDVVPAWVKKTASPKEEQSNGWLQDAQKDCCPSMSRVQRIIGFCFCILMGIICFSLAALYTPLLILKARKFALLFTLGSLFFIGSFSFLWGPMNHIRHLFSKEQLSFTLPYVGTLFATLYFALGPKSTALTVLFAVLQIVTLIIYIASSVPGISFITRIFSSKVVSKTLPV